MWNKQNRVLKKVNLTRKFEFEDWGFTLTGGWDQGQWIGTSFNLKNKLFLYLLKVLQNKKMLYNAFL